MFMYGGVTYSREILTNNNGWNISILMQFTFVSIEFS